MEQITSDRSEFLGMLKEGSDELYADMKENLPKKIEKMKKNLTKINQQLTFYNYSCSLLLRNSFFSAFLCFKY